MEKSVEAEMNAAFALAQDEMRGLFEEIAGDRGSKPERIARVARALGWTFRRVKGHWYGDARRIDLIEMDAARDAARRLRDDAEIRADNQRLRSRLAILEARLSVGDEEFHGPARDALRQQMDRH